MSFLFLYMNSLGASKALMGLSLAVATISELPVWFYSNRMIERSGTRTVLVISLLACAVQGFAYSLMVNPLWALPIQLLHGLAFSASWAAGVAYSGKIRRRASARPRKGSSPACHLACGPRWARSSVGCSTRMSGRGGICVGGSRRWWGWRSF